MLLLEVDASKVVAGWLPLGLVLLLGVVIALLYLNMRKHLRRGNALPTEADVRAQRRTAAAAATSAAGPSATSAAGPSAATAQEGEAQPG